MTDEIISRDVQIEIMQFFIKTSIPRILNMESTEKLAENIYE